MKHGVLTLVDWDPADGPVAARYRQIVERAVLAEELGYDSFWVGEHHGSSFYCCPSPQLLLAAIAARTRRIRIGTGVSLPAHHDPARLAEDLAMLDQISAGRLDVVLGRANFARGFHSLGQRPEEGRARTEEAVRFLRGAWTERPFSFAGRYRSLSDADLQPPPYQKPHPPLFLGAGSVESARFAAEQGLHLGVLSVFAPPEAFRPVVQAYRERASEQGRARASLRIAAGRHALVAESTGAALGAFEPCFERYSRGLESELVWRPPSTGPLPAPGQTPLTRGAYAERVAAFACCGGPGDAADQVVALCRALGGVDHYWSYFDLGGCPPDAVERSMRLYALEVAPRVDRRLAEEGLA